MTGTYQVDLHFYPEVAGFFTEAAKSDENDPRLAPYISLAIQILSSHDLEIDDNRRLTLIVRAALDARTHFFSAARHEPDQEELEQFFADFVIRCVVPRCARCE